MPKPLGGFVLVRTGFHVVRAAGRIPAELGDVAEVFEPQSCTASFGGSSPSAERAVGGAEGYFARKNLPKVFDSD